MVSAYLVYVLLMCWTFKTMCVGPTLKLGPKAKNADDTEAHEYVAILEELKTITELVLRRQNTANSEMIAPVVHDCTTLKEAGIKANGVYSIFPFTFQVYCDMITDGGGWTLIQRRVPVDVHEDFNRSWSDYRFGFGDLYKEFWLGLEPLHQLTHSADYELRIDMVDYEIGSKYAKYKVMKVGPESDGFRLTVSNYSGNAGDALSMFHSGRRFSTYDQDQDVSRNKSCALEKGGGWWFHACYAAHLNGLYPTMPKRKSSSSQIRWWSDREHVLVLSKVEMKIRRHTRFEPYKDSQDDSTKVLDKDDEEETDLDYRYIFGGDKDTISYGYYDEDEDVKLNVTNQPRRSDVSPWEVSHGPGYD